MPETNEELRRRALAGKAEAEEAAARLHLKAAEHLVGRGRTEPPRPDGNRPPNAIGRWAQAADAYGKAADCLDRAAEARAEIEELDAPYAEDIF